MSDSEFAPDRNDQESSDNDASSSCTIVGTKRRRTDHANASQRRSSRSSNTVTNNQKKSKSKAKAREKYAKFATNSKLEPVTLNDDVSFLSGSMVNGYHYARAKRTDQLKYAKVTRSFCSMLTEVMCNEKCSRFELFDSVHMSMRIHAQQRSLYTTPLLLDHSFERNAAIDSAHYNIMRYRSVSLNFCAIRNDWPSRFLHMNDFSESQNASMLFREQSSLLVVSLESIQCQHNSHEQTKLSNMFAQMQQFQLHPPADPYQYASAHSDQQQFNNAAAAATETVAGAPIDFNDAQIDRLLHMYQRPMPLQFAYLDPHKPCHKRFRTKISTQQLTSSWTNEQLDRHTAAMAAMEIACVINQRDQMGRQRNNQKKKQHLYSVTPQIVLLVGQSNLSMLSVFTQVFAACRLPLGMILPNTPYEDCNVAQALDSALVQRAVLDRLPIECDANNDQNVNRQRTAIDSFTLHRQDRKLQLHAHTLESLEKHQLFQQKCVNLASHRQETIDSNEYHEMFVQLLFSMQEPLIIQQFSSLHSTYAEIMQPVLHQASKDMVENCRRAYILPQRHDMHNHYQCSRTFASRIAYARVYNPSLVHQYYGAWGRDIALTFSLILLHLPHLIGGYSLRQAQYSTERLMNWWNTADRTVHSTDFKQLQKHENILLSIDSLDTFDILNMMRILDNKIKASLSQNNNVSQLSASAYPMPNLLTIVSPACSQTDNAPVASASEIPLLPQVSPPRASAQSHSNVLYDQTALQMLSAQTLEASQVNDNSASPMQFHTNDHTFELLPMIKSPALSNNFSAQPIVSSQTNENVYNHHSASIACSVSPNPFAPTFPNQSLSPSPHAHVSSYLYHTPLSDIAAPVSIAVEKPNPQLAAAAQALTELQQSPVQAQDKPDFEFVVCAGTVCEITTTQHEFQLDTQADCIFITRIDHRSVQFVLVQDVLQLINKPLHYILISNIVYIAKVDSNRTHQAISKDLLAFAPVSRLLFDRNLFQSLVQPIYCTLSCALTTISLCSIIFLFDQGHIPQDTLHMFMNCTSRAQILEASSFLQCTSDRLLQQHYSAMRFSPMRDLEINSDLHLRVHHQHAQTEDDQDALCYQGIVQCIQRNYTRTDFMQVKCDLSGELVHIRLCEIVSVTVLNPYHAQSNMICKQLRFTSYIKPSPKLPQSKQIDATEFMTDRSV